MEMDVTLYFGDCRLILPTLETNSVDAVFFDPPYNAKKEYGIAPDNLPEAEYIQTMMDVLAQSRRVARKSVSVFVAGKMIPLFTLLMPGSHLVVIVKRAAGVVREGWRQQYHGLFCEGRPEVVGRDVWDDLRLPGEGYFFREERYGHPGITSLALTRRVIERMTCPGDSVLDPFMGVGTTGVAARQAGRVFVGIEMNPPFFEIARGRLVPEGG